MFDVGDLSVLTFGNCGLLDYLYVFTFLHFFSKYKKHDFLTFF